MEHPYRAELVRFDGTRALLAEPEPPPRRVRVRAWSDGTTRIRLRAVPNSVARLGYAISTLVFSAFVADPGDRGAGLILASLFAVLFMRTFRAEQITVSPAAVSRRTRLGRSEVRALSDVSTVVVSGSGENAKLDLQCGRERVPLADGLGYDEATLRWIAQRLRRAIDHTGAAR